MTISPVFNEATPTNMVEISFTATSETIQGILRFSTWYYHNLSRSSYFGFHSCPLSMMQTYRFNYVLWHNSAQVWNEADSCLLLTWFNAHKYNAANCQEYRLTSVPLYFCQTYMILRIVWRVHLPQTYMVYLVRSHTVSLEVRLICFCQIWFPSISRGYREYIRNDSMKVFTPQSIWIFVAQLIIRGIISLVNFA